jgi:hypothetical protein
VSRQLGDERERYGRKSLRERVEDVVEWPASHRVATGVLIAFVAASLLLTANRGLLVDPRQLAVGDCLFVRASGSLTDVRPIGDQQAVTESIVAGRVEKASCTASHGHEVSAVIDLAALRYPLPEAQARCAQAFEPYVGLAIEASRYTTFAAVPTPTQQSAGASFAICLVARDDGQWMDQPARGSRE